MAAPIGTSGLVDTDILIDAERGSADAVGFLASIRNLGSIRISVISAMELVIGCRNALELTNVREVLEYFVVVPIDPSISTCAAQLVDAYHLSHGLLIPDALIGATAIEGDGLLYTKNVRHFQMIPRLTVVRPYR